MRGFSSGGLLMALVLMSPASQARDIANSGGVNHRPVCSRAVGPVARCHAQIVTDREGNAISAQAPINGYGPADLRDAYKITATGSGATVIAAVDAFGYDNAESDFAVYRAQFGLPPCTTANGCFRKLNQKGQNSNYPPQDIGWAEESALDLDMASAMCPNCKIWLIEARTSAFKNLAAAVNTAVALGAHVIANSYGGRTPGKAIQQTYRQPGVALTASAGDSGFGEQFPASSPFVTAVGGTTLLRDGSTRGWAETSWGTGACTNFKKPPWQADSGCIHRTVVDVAAVADPATGVAVYGPNGNGISSWLEFGGTSVGAPLIAGVYGANGGTVKFGSNPYGHPEALFDIVSGPGGSCNPDYLCNAGPGYDGPTGLGTPNGVSAFGN